MYYTYILYSDKAERYYVGMSEDVKVRLQQHNAGRVISTKSFLPWLVVHVEGFKTRLQARNREKYLKTAAGRRWRKVNIGPRGATE